MVKNKKIQGGKTGAEEPSPMEGLCSVVTAGCLVNSISRAEGNFEVILVGFTVQGSNSNSGNGWKYPGSKQSDCSHSWAPINSLEYVEQNSVMQGRKELRRT